MAANKNWLSVNRWGAAPALLFTAACFVAPLIAMALVSVSERIGGHTVLTWTLDNYRGFVSRSDGAFVSALVNSIEVTVTVTILSVLAAYPLAYILAYRVPKRWQRVALVAIVLPFWTSYVIRSYSWLLVLSENGIISQTLLSLGVTDGTIGTRQLARRHGARLRAFLRHAADADDLCQPVADQGLLRKAAADLGANGFQIFLHVTLPLSLPGVAVGAFLTFVLAVGDYITPQILGGGKELLLPQAIMLQIGRAADFPMASALSMILMLVVTAAYLLFARYLRMERV